MTGAAVHRLERKSRPVRGSDYVALELRREMEEGGWTAKQLSRAIRDQTPYSLDYRTIQNAMGASCTLDTFLVLAAFFDWDEFADAVLEQVRQERREAALEAKVARHRAEMAAAEQDLARYRAALEGAPVGRGLRLVAASEGPSPARPRGEAGTLGAVQAPITGVAGPLTGDRP